MPRAQRCYGALVEIRYGFAAGDVSAERHDALEDFLALFQIDDFPASAAEDHAAIRCEVFPVPRDWV